MVSVRLMQQVDTEEGGCGKEELILVLVFGLSKNLDVKDREVWARTDFGVGRESTLRLTRKLDF